MRSYLAKILRFLRKKETGFTLVELLVVVGIIVGLAAAVVPRLSGFSDKGDEGARASELDTVQTAFDTAMTQNSATALTPSTTANNTLAPTELSTNPVSSYLRSTPQYFYCWDSVGTVVNVSSGTVPLASGDPC